MAFPYLIELPKIIDARGNLSVVENCKEIPFDIRRVYWLYEVPTGELRGGHAHTDLEQVLIALHGDFTIIVDDGNTHQTFRLNRPNQGLYISSNIWREMSDFSEGAVCLVLASKPYDPTGYIRNYDEFRRGVLHTSNQQLYPIKQGVCNTPQQL
ncbi:MAG: FdtA/QdtA family cupin domain-containing protein [Bacteroidales bacterium]|jgi:dTDP-4-dehydrorhamnose 3,5-epimerase-like enzyme|nr:FdtA/QdtA family cupin domain-containing protein [Bacteroidales bacterium]